MPVPCCPHGTLPEALVPGQPVLPARWPSSIDSCSGIGNSKLSPVDKETHLVISDDTQSTGRLVTICPAPDQRALQAVSSPLWYSVSPPAAMPHPPWPAFWTPADSALLEKPRSLSMPVPQRTFSNSLGALSSSWPLHPLPSTLSLLCTTQCFPGIPQQASGCGRPCPKPLVLVAVSLPGRRTVSILRAGLSSSRERNHLGQ